MKTESGSHIVSLLKSSGYGESLKGDIAQLLCALDVDGALLQPGAKVLVKPNLLTDRLPEQAVTTHPEMVRAVIRVLKEKGMEVSVGDSPASAVKVERVWEKTGFRDLCEEENVPLLNLEEAGSRLIQSNGYEFNVSKPVLESDLVVNVPKLKTHTLTMLTAAVKNYYGTLPGYQKANRHKAYPKPDDFGQYVLELYRQMPPNLNIVDAIVGMEGDGPSGGNPVELGFIAGSSDAIALDFVLCDILSIKPSTVPYLRKLVNEYAIILTKGSEPSDLAPSSFKLPNTLLARLIPGWLANALGPFMWIRPEIMDNCIGCALCVEACPVKALSIDKRVKKATLEGSKCISCCCCHEICPEKAIRMVCSPLINFIRNGRVL